jgi:hypothetical protein
MGTDATLFARRARRAVYLDRLYDWRPHGEAGEVLYDKLRGRCRGDGKASADDLIKLCGILMGEEAAAAVTDGEVRNEKSWLWQTCIAFAKEHPNDRFFIQSDHDEPTWWDIEERGGYTTWDPYVTKLAPWHLGYVAPRPPPPPEPMTPEQRLSIEDLARALEAGYTPPTELRQGSALVVESLDVVMSVVTYEMPHEPRTWRETARYLTRWWHWRDLLTRGPRSFWWHARNRVLPLNLHLKLPLAPQEPGPVGFDG